MVGSFDGELLSANFVRPEGDENTDDVRSCLQVHEVKTIYTVAIELGCCLSYRAFPFKDGAFCVVGYGLWVVCAQG